MWTSGKTYLYKGRQCINRGANNFDIVGGAHLIIEPGYEYLITDSPHQIIEVPKEPENFFNTKCPHCDKICEPHFSISGPHIKQTCGTCGAYIKFVSKNVLRDILEVRAKIWAFSKQNASLIELAKVKIDFFDPKGNGTIAKIMYWNLYIKVQELVLKLDDI